MKDTPDNNSSGNDNSDRSGHLRLHSVGTDRPSSTQTASKRHRGRHASKPRENRQDPREQAVEQFMQAYTEATGWRLDGKQGLDSPNFALQPGDLTPSDALDGMLTSHDVDSGTVPMVGRQDAHRLAMAAAQLTGQWKQAEETVRDRDADLAAFEARIGRPAKQPTSAAELQRILSDAVAATAFDAAAMYVLDDDTTKLSLRSLFGLDPRRLLDPPRALSKARADLEAMVCGICTIDDLHAVVMDTWNCPEPDFGSALCATINADDLPLGTLWLYGREPRVIAPTQAASARLAASHLASLICTFSTDQVNNQKTSVRVLDGFAGNDTRIKTNGQRDSHKDGGSLDFGFDPSDLNADNIPSLAPAPRAEQTTATGSGVDKKSRLDTNLIDDLCRWQYSSLPLGAQISEDFFVDGMIESARPFSVGWHHWDVLPDGMLAFMMAEASDSGLAGAMTATFAKSAAISHLGYRHGVLDLLCRISDSLWQMEVEGQTCSLLYARVDPATGEGEIASAGHLQAIVSGANGHRPVIAPNERPLAMDFEPNFATADFQLHSGETLLCSNPSLRKLRTTDELGRITSKASQKGSSRPLSALARNIQECELGQERSAAAMTRRS